MARKKTADKMVQTLVWLMPKQKSGLDALSAKTGATMSWFVREAIDDLLKKYKRKGDAR